ncbi:hypothetical protein KC19_1G101800 [Ceratodon purpureus]|uniref:ubiquitinyl hydrolase 1 n=1 Tax=Ceratodon purpureus TaxID=3225 RepID=A0A8T0J6D4_CERPU|nr:hypothetical protein KC19_1G101800 [Ceratodon purpureus]
MAVDVEESSENLYHERQHFQFCLLHCLNNLLQGENCFTRDELDSIADGLPTAITGSSVPNPLSLIFKPHRNTVTGNYDANVLISALNARGREAVWFDRRKGVEDLLSEVAGYGDRLLGMIVNFSTKKWLGMWQGRHWVAIRKLQGMWYNLDSDNAAPICFVNGENGLGDYLSWVISSEGVVIFVLNSSDIPSDVNS